jgi:hypothetical protein
VANELIILDSYLFGIIKSSLKAVVVQIEQVGFVEIPYVPADESAVLADGSVLKHALKPASAGFHLLSRMLQHSAPKDVYRASKSMFSHSKPAHLRN